MPSVCVPLFHDHKFQQNQMFHQSETFNRDIICCVLTQGIFLQFLAFLALVPNL